MDPFFFWLERTPPSVWLRESTSVWAYPAILSAHAIGMAMAAGVNAALALHLLGVGPGIPAREMKRFVPVMWLGFWLNAVSGMALLTAYPTKALTNPLFYVKLSLIALSMGIYGWMSGRVFRDRDPELAGERLGERLGGPPGERRTLRFLAGVSLAGWAGAIIAGRLLAYTYTRLLADF